MARAARQAQRRRVALSPHRGIILAAVDAEVDIPPWPAGLAVAKG